MNIALLKKLFDIDIKDKDLKEIKITKVNNNSIALEHLFTLDFASGQAKHIKTIDAVTKEVVSLC